ncbi:DUF3224 domain-containing protein [Gulosibacter molinativorax]|uniref:DUF3224 domain-containing protein n=1 Tax=Gulosibacter molinativorax TaxID=256821 RepID=A0ABT7C7M7_9MICO|nr:DUF3224 domain-containing protein [Gulosibacter molinativorax]MDJ1371216.1 DUF3224 domain-containing protein [Gulosibacter molinativorax]QUY63032.1 Hypotetical protein [Gulosibacter molinativorax]
MRASSSFQIDVWDANGHTPDVETGAPLAGFFIRRTFTGEEITGASQVLMVSAFNNDNGSGTYVAIDAFEGEIAGRRGTLNFWHTSTVDHGRFVAEDALLKIVPASGTGDLLGARGTGRIVNRGDLELLELEIEFGDESSEQDLDGEAAIGKLEPPAEGAE